MMAKKPTALASIFDDDESDTPVQERSAETVPMPPLPAPARTAAKAKPAARSGATRNHGTKKPVLIHIPEDMHRLLRRISVEEGEHLTQITERMLRQYLVAKGHTKFAP